MQSIKLTPSQQAAVENEGGALLVAAAAGSGKTKVLVDRLMRSILDPVHPKNVDDFLIITYTKAAAAELRAKISAELSRQVALQPDNRHLQRQMRRIYQTKISTIHAFCADLLRSYGHIIDVPSDFRVTEETQTLLLRQAVKERLFEQLYETYEDDPELQGLLDQFGYGRDDRNLEKLLFSVYDKVQSFSDPQRWLTECRRKLELDRDADAGQTPWGRYLLQELRRYLQQQIDIFEREIKLAQEDGALAKAYVPVFAENVSQMRRLLACRTWDEAVQAWPREFGRLSAARSCEAPELMQAMKSDRTRCWDGLKQRLGYFYGDSREVLEDLASSHAGLRGVIRLVELFSSAYQTEKRRQRSLDFSDLEHESLRLLFQKDTALPSALAREVSEQFSEIMVDEYQDSNEVQDRIFAAISKQGQNLFFVGDVKQSIYRFRLADPRIFLNKYQSFAEAAEAAPGEPRRILLSENFRSGKAILEAVNQVFETVMSRQFGDMDYTEAEKLKPGLTLPPISGTPVELHCIAYSGADDTEESGDKTQVEAAFLARRIQRLLHEGAEVTTKDGVRPVQPGDIVILLRSLSNTAPVYLEKLHALGIPAVSDKAGSILDTKEAEVFLSLLQVLENPHQDIPLVAVLASPIFGLTADELAELRLKNRTGDLYEALKCQASQSRKVQNCLSLLQALRDQSKWLTLQELLDALVHSTGLLDVFAAMQAGEQRVKNLQALLSLADTYCAAQPATLLDFVQYLLGLKNAGIHVVADTQDAGDCVKIMSIHKSKGLEFPVVCLPDLSRKFNDADLVQEVLLHEDLGLGGNCFDPTTMTKFPTIGKKAISLELQKQNRAEELRVLYVAMTRAKDRLIMSYCSRYLQREVTALSQRWRGG